MGRPKWLWAGRAVALASLLLALTAACLPGQFDEDEAVQIARDFVVAGQPSDAVFLDLTNDEPQDAGGKWRVYVDATVRYSSDSGLTQLHYIIDVDRSTGVPTIYAQG
jgi:hypothetical protein